MSSLSNSVLPDVMVEEILVRLPVEPIGRFRCVSKPWQSLLTNPKFLKRHHRLKPTTRYLFTNSHILTLSAGESSGTASDGAARKLLPPTMACLETYTGVIGSCNGLFLFEDIRVHGFALINPITLETVHIVDDRDPCVCEYNCYHGLGYDSSNDDYKIVSMSWKRDDCGNIDNGNIVDVYSVRMKCWNRISDSSPYSLLACYDIYPGGVFLNGRIQLNLPRSKHNLIKGVAGSS